MWKPEKLKMNLINKPVQEIENLALKLIDENREHKSDLKEKERKQLSFLLSNSRVLDLLHSVRDPKFLRQITVEKLILLARDLHFLNEEIQEIRKNIELEKFFKDGNIIDEEGLKELYKKRRLDKLFPEFRLKKLIDIVKNPPLNVKTYDDTEITFDAFLVKKILTAIVQMIFNQMDFKIINAGEEGSGKSCLSSQQMRLFFHILSHVGLATYEYNINSMMFSSIDAHIHDKDQQDADEFFRIRCLDEAYDLNRQNYREMTNRIFKDEMRRGRKRLNIDILNLPQLGELEIAITLSRTNFIFICKMDNEVKTQTLNKGKVEMYIIPRADYIYSNYYKKNIGKTYIKNTLARLLEKKENYYLDMPKDILIHIFTFQEKWGFNPTSYTKHVKKQNKDKSLKKDMVVTEYQQYIIFEKFPSIKDLGTFNMKDPQEKKMYYTLQKFIKSIKKKFSTNYELLSKYKIMYATEKEFTERKSS